MGYYEEEFMIPVRVCLGTIGTALSVCAFTAVSTIVSLGVAHWIITGQLW